MARREVKGRRPQSLGSSVFASVALLGPVCSTALAVTWYRKVTQIVPEPYLDEYFHVRQAQLYCTGNFSYWDPKITTPPGLYLVSYLLLRLGLSCDIIHLRQINVIILATGVFLPSLLLLLARQAQSGRSLPDHYNSQSSRILIHSIYGALNISLFPPLFFFAGLYYTDVASTAFVIFFLCLRQDPTLARWPTSRGLLLVVTGLAALFFRQTNIFWVAVFPAGLDVVELLKDKVKQPGQISAEARLSFVEVVVKAWHSGVIYDLPVHEAYLEDYGKTIMSIAVAAIVNLKDVILAILPYIALLGTFGTFVLVNGGVVLGDKSNHIATLHTPQMLYIWPYIVFFSIPLIGPPALATLIPASLLPNVLTPYRNPTTTLPRLLPTAVFLAAALASIHYNTIIHPFTLADNRHYVFYVFRLLRLHPVLKYLAAPIYLLCAWAVLQTLSAPPPPPPPSSSRGDQNPATTTSPTPTATNTTTLLLWLLTSALPLITAPLVEPRYFILPWLLWRLQLPRPAFSPPQQLGTSNPTLAPHPSTPSKPTRITQPTGTPSQWTDSTTPLLLLETLWFLLINGVTCYVFLWRDFEWAQEPGVAQRFLW